MRIGLRVGERAYLWLQVELLTSTARTPAGCPPESLRRGHDGLFTSALLERLDHHDAEGRGKETHPVSAGSCGHIP